MTWDPGGHDGIRCSPAWDLTENGRRRCIRTRSVPASTSSAARAQAGETSGRRSSTVARGRQNDSVEAGARRSARTWRKRRQTPCGSASSSSTKRRRCPAVTSAARANIQRRTRRRPGTSKTSSLRAEKAQKGPPTTPRGAFLLNQMSGSRYRAK